MSVGEAGVWGISPANEVLLPYIIKMRFFAFQCNDHHHCPNLNEGCRAWADVRNIHNAFNAINGNLLNFESNEKVMYRDGTFGLPGEAEGSSWTKVCLIKSYHGWCITSLVSSSSSLWSSSLSLSSSIGWWYDGLGSQWSGYCLGGEYKVDHDQHFKIEWSVESSPLSSEMIIITSNEA